MCMISWEMMKTGYKYTLTHIHLWVCDFGDFSFFFFLSSLFYFILEMGSCCYPGWSAVAIYRNNRYTAALGPMILPGQPHK